MQTKHLLVEGYCDGDNEKGEYPCDNTYQLGTQCFTCPKFSFSQCPNEIALSNDVGVVEGLEDFIGLGGDMLPKENERQERCIKAWKEISKRKIEEAYMEYMK